MELSGLDMGKVTRVQKKLLGSVVFLKLVCTPVCSDSAYAENRVYHTYTFFTPLTSRSFQL